MSGQTLKADHLNHIEDGIASIPDLDWNKMDNRPFGETEPSKYIVEPCEKTGTFRNGICHDLLWWKDIKYLPTSGTECTFELNGVSIIKAVVVEEFSDYGDVFYKFEGSNYDVVNSTYDGDGEPYYITLDDTGSALSVALDAETYGLVEGETVTVAIYESSEKIIKQIDEKFIPETIARVENIPSGLDIPTYKKDEITQELIVELAKNRAMFIYEENADSNSDSVWAQRAIVTSYKLAPGEDDGCGDTTPPKLEFCSGFLGALSYEYINDDIWNEIKEAWNL